MIEELSHLKTTLDNHNSGNIVISEQLYDLLLQEKDRIEELILLVNKKRGEHILRVNFGDIISEQIAEIPIPEKGFTREEISSIRTRISDPNRKILDYDLEKDKSKEAMNYKKMRKILNKGPEIKKRLDVFEKKPKGMIYVYAVLKGCYMNEFFNNMNCNTYDEIVQSFGSMTINLSQVDWLFKNEKLSLKTEYVVLSLIDGNFLFLNVYCHEKGSFKRFPTGLAKGKKLLLFSPTDIDMEEKYFQK